MMKNWGTQAKHSKKELTDSSSKRIELFQKRLIRKMLKRYKLKDVRRAKNKLHYEVCFLQK